MLVKTVFMLKPAEARKKKTFGDAADGRFGNVYSFKNLLKTSFLCQFFPQLFEEYTL